MIVPFAGSRADAERMLASFASLRLGAGDELILVDNNPEPVVAAIDAGPARVLHAAAEASSYYARNAGARETVGEWLLFIDSDCVPEPDLIERYLAEPPGERCALLAGSVRASGEGESLAAAYAGSRGQVSETPHLESGPHPAGITANLMVRRTAWEEAGGFEEGIRSGGDLDLCWRIQEAGWTLERREDARVAHLHSATLREALRRAARYGGGCRWIESRYPGASAMLPLGRSLARSAGGAIVWALALKPRRALFKLIDGAWAIAMAWGFYVAGNEAETRPQLTESTL